MSILTHCPVFPTSLLPLGGVPPILGLYLCGLVVSYWFRLLTYSLGWSCFILFSHFFRPLYVVSSLLSFLYTCMVLSPFLSFGFVCTFVFLFFAFLFFLYIFSMFIIILYILLFFIYFYFLFFGAFLLFVFFAFLLCHHSYPSVLDLMLVPWRISLMTNYWWDDSQLLTHHEKRIAAPKLCQSWTFVYGAPGMFHWRTNPVASQRDQIFTDRCTHYWWVWE